MSDQSPGGEMGGPPGDRSGSPGHNRVVAVLMVLVGLLLLAPGICGAIFTAIGIPNVVAFIGILVGVGGGALIVRGIRRFTTAPPATAASETGKIVVLLLLLFAMVVFALWLASLMGVRLFNTAPWR